MTQNTICLIIFIITIGSYILNKIPMALTSLVAMFMLIITGCIDAETALGGFSDSTVIIMVSMFVVAAGLNRTQMVSKISKLVYKVSGGSFTKGLAGYVLVTALLAQVVSSAILVFSIVYPLVLDFCKKMKVSASKAMFSIGIISISCIQILPIGSGATSYLTNNKLLETYGYTGHAFTMFSTMYAKLPFLVAMVLYAIFVAPKFAPDKGDVDANVHGRTIQEKKPLDPVREFLGYMIFLVVVVCLIFINYLPLESWQICMAGALFTVLAGVLTEREAVSAMNLPVAFLYIGGLTLGKALVSTGAGTLIGNTLAGMLGKNPSGYLVGLVFFLIPFALTQVMVNHSVMQSMKPIVILTCMSLGYNPVGPLILSTAGSLTAFMTPLATPAVPLFMALGGYSQKDMIKMSWAPALIACVSSVLWTMTIFPVV